MWFLILNFFMFTSTPIYLFVLTSLHLKLSLTSLQPLGWNISFSKAGHAKFLFTIHIKPVRNLAVAIVGFNLRPERGPLNHVVLYNDAVDLKSHWDLTMFQDLILIRTTDVFYSATLLGYGLRIKCGLENLSLMKLPFLFIILFTFLWVFIKNPLTDFF